MGRSEEEGVISLRYMIWEVMLWIFVTAVGRGISYLVIKKSVILCHIDWSVIFYPSIFTQVLLNALLFRRNVLYDN